MGKWLKFSPRTLELSERGQELRDLVNMTAGETLETRLRLLDQLFYEHFLIAGIRDGSVRLVEDRTDQRVTRWWYELRDRHTGDDDAAETA